MTRPSPAERAAIKDKYLRAFFARQERTYSGWTPGKVREEWEALFKAQGGACAICHRPFRLQIRGRGSSNGRMPATDHNHLTNEIRGLLCGGSLDPKTCNRLIGYHNAATLRRAADYLEHPPARAVLLQLRTGDGLMSALIGLHPSDPAYWRALRPAAEPEQVTMPEPEHTSRDPWPADFPLPRGVAQLKRTAEASGWSVREQYSRGYVPHGKTGRPTGYAHRIALQALHPVTLARAVMVYRIPCEGGAKVWESILLTSRAGMSPYANATDAKDFLLLSGSALPSWYEAIRAREQGKAQRAKAAAKPPTKRRESGG